MKEKTKKEKTNSKIEFSRLGMSVVLIIAPILVVIFGLIGYFSIFEQYTTSKSLTQDIVNETSVANTNRVDGFLYALNSQFDGFKTALENANLESDEAKNNLFKATDGLSESSVGTFYLGAASSNYYLDVSGYQLEGKVADKDWYQVGANSEGTTFTSPYLDSATNEFIFSVVSPINSKDFDKDAVLSSDFSLSSLVNSMTLVDEDNTYHTIVIDKDEDTILMDENKENIGKTFSSNSSLYTELSKMMSSSKASSSQEITVENDIYFCTYSQSQLTDWITITYSPYNVSMAAFERVKIILLLIFVISLLFTGLAISFIISYKLKDLRQLNSDINLMSKGDFRFDLSSKRKDEIGEISNNINDFSKHMRDVLEQLKSLADTLNNQVVSSINISENVGDSTIAQAESSQELGSAVEELSKSIYEIAENATNLSATVSTTTENSETTKVLMQDTITKANIGKDNMDNVKHSMEEIKDIIEELVATVTSVKESSGEINKVTTIIGDIARQTNLLSINASIEAAHAGEAGKGFAVVAGEISKLAKDSTDSVESISKLLNTIVEQIQETLVKTNQTVEKIGESNSLVSDAYTTFGEIDSSISESGKSVDIIIDEINNINDVASNMAAITEEQSASSEEIASTADSLGAQAGAIKDNAMTLKQEADRLKIDTDNLMDIINSFKY